MPYTIGICSYVQVSGLFLLMWERAVRSLAAAALASDVTGGSGDVTVQNLQLLLLLFHSLQLMQKKTVLLEAANQLLQVHK